MTAWELFERTQSGNLPPVFKLRGEDALVEREWKKALVAQGFEVEESDWASRGPDANVESLCLGTSLFSPRRVVWCRRPAPASKWDESAEAMWARIAKSADGDGLVVVVQIPSDKRLKWDVLGKKLDEVSLEIAPSARLPWIKRMNESRGSPLKSEEMNFLSMQDAELLQIDTWVELWSLGGAAWATQTLGYGQPQESGGVVVDNPAFAWVDAVLVGDRASAHRQLKTLKEGRSEPLQLLALLSKSVRILSSLETGGGAVGQPDFLVGKLRNVQRKLAPREPARGRRLLKKCAELDRQFKSTAVNAWASLAML